MDDLPGPRQRRTVGGARGSAASAIVAALHHAVPDRVLVAVANGPTAAVQLEADLETLLEQEGSHLFPQREALPFEEGEPHLEVGGLRVEAVEALYAGRTRLLVTTPRALQERNPIPRGLADLRLTIERGSDLPIRRLQSALEERGFERASVVEEVGQFAVRGGIVDLFSFGAPEPVRVEYWGDEVRSIRFFDVLDQRSTREVERAHVLPVDFRRMEGEAADAVSRSLLDLLPAGALLLSAGPETWDDEAERSWKRVGELHRSAGRRTTVGPADLFLDPGDFAKARRAFPLLELVPGHEGDHVLRTRPPPAIERDMDRLGALLREASARGEETLLLCDNEGQVERLEEILGGPGSLPTGSRLMVGSVAEGFVLECSDPPLRVLTDHEIFRRTRRIRRSRRFRGAVSLDALAQLSPGDYVVHMDHGIGRFRGLEHVEVGGEELEALAIEYAGGEILRVPVHRLDLVERWVGGDDDAEPRRVHRIGGKRWKNLKGRTEAAIEEMTAELLHLYAERSRAEGHAYPPDTRWQKEMESSFLYEDTPDQRKATTEVKADMESPRPMDRLICGDVGYGKTEIAIRAAFKAIQDGKQVAILAPTTILVEQHRHTFDERLAEYPVRVEAISRFRTPSEQKEILAGVREGSVDVVIGTHRLLSEDVRFADLGLLVVDEEQRFGVRHKERLKKLRTAVDVLTLTATPIPRTLYLSLSGVRDLTLIRTPPRDRMPILTHVLPWNDHVLTDALLRELDRGGQTFFLHNRVETIHTVAERVRRLVPDARVDVAHGQMAAGELDEAMRAFVDGETDVLVCTSIIENGLDVPNANTLVVDRADRFGLSQLYQIRGRVGRSDRRAYCYLLTPEEVSEEAEQRLRVLEHYTELGSGYSVALRDLELRGAGNLLGADQSGFAHQVGLDTYLRLVEKTVTRMRRQEEEGEREHPLAEVALPGPAYLPDGYVSDSGQKLHLYRRLSRVTDPAGAAALREEMSDRFGPLPPEADRLLTAAALRSLGRRLGIRRILVREDEARITFGRNVVPRLQRLQAPLRDRQVEVEVRRMDPLSLVLKRVGVRPLDETLLEALTLLAEQRAEAA